LRVLRAKVFYRVTNVEAIGFVPQHEAVMYLFQVVAAHFDLPELTPESFVRNNGCAFGLVGSDDAN